MRKSKTKEPKADDAAIKAIELRAFRLAQVAASLMSSRVQHFFQQGHPRDLTDPAWDLEFNSALKRAEMLMSSTIERDSDIHAYQVFREGDVLTEEQIAAEFKLIEWDGLKSKQPITNLLSDLHAKMREHFELEEMRNPFNPDAKTTELLGKVEDCLSPFINDPSIQMCMPNFGKLVDQFMMALDESIPQVAFGQTHHEWTAAAAENGAFLEWCFPFKRSGHGEVRKYRPHEIFRFAAKMKWREEGLVVTLSSLERSFNPFPQRAYLNARFAKFDRAHEEGIANWQRQSEDEPTDAPTSAGLDDETPRVEEPAAESMKAGK